ncbi:MAG: dephospho-CoA kinase [Clostridia bacterium]|nr:dephospho-CoA kinase [Clostridia bacterium]
MTLILGVSGGIGSGKSTVSSYIMDKTKCKCIDADKMSHDMCKAGSKQLMEIVKHFGSEVLTSDGNLNRKYLGDIVFNDPSKLEVLEHFTTDKIVEEIHNEVKQYKEMEDCKLVLLDAPLLFEKDLYKLCDINLLVTCDLDRKIERLMARDGFGREQIISRINNQMSDEEKSKFADVILDNSKDLDYLYNQIDQFLERNNIEF